MSKRPAIPITASGKMTHLTWASGSVSSTMRTTRDFLGRRLWAWPIIAVVLLLAIGWGVHSAIQVTMEANLASHLETVRDVEVAMLRRWLLSQQNNALSVARDTEVRHLVNALVATPQDEPSTPDSPDAAARQLAKQLGPMMNSHEYDSFFVADRSVVVAASRKELVGMEVPAAFSPTFDRVFDGQATVTPPFASLLPYLDDQGRRRTGVPVMFVAAPVVDSHLQVIAVLGLMIRPEEEFTRILQLGQLNDSGETYAFNRDGLMLSNSRFDDELVLLGVLPDQEGSRSILQLLVRDPQGDMTRGFRPQVRRSQLPLTEMAASAVRGESAVNVNGYRDYRGVRVVGAWSWLTEYDFGVATEVDYAEAFRPLTILKRTFWGLLLLLGASSLAIFVFTIRVARLQRQARHAAIEARQLGQYQLEEKIGAGAMGTVYKARHAMLRRPTAIKLIDADKVTDASIARFEREVQITSRLNHPNTIAIYDYGRTPEDVFYYAMEYLDGFDLQQLVDTYGPQPPTRVIYILEQICGSLYEAHTTGLVHRDVKPANIMLNRRGGEGDVVKVLDFGLVKALEEDAAENRAAGMAGTPLYMSPEAIQFPGSVDACSDLYAVGAVGYFLVTGTPVFLAKNFSDLCEQHMSASPQPPSSRLGRPVPQDLEDALLACLEKNRAKRPQTARDLSRWLNRCEAAGQWSVDDADAWWGRYERGQLDRSSGQGPLPAVSPAVSPTTSPEAKGNHDATIDLE